MRKTILYLLPCLFCFVLQGCLKDKLTMTYTILRPVYKEKAEVYANIKSNAPTAIQQPGKVFIYGDYIFLNEVDKGIHIIDNANPARPVVKAFINIPGNLDIAVKGNTLYADLYADLVVVDISNPLQARFIKYIANVFRERNYTGGFTADSTRVIVGWIKKDTTVSMRNTYCATCAYLLLSGAQGAGVAAAGGPIGVAGSMARFSLVNNYLYTVNSRELSSFNINNSNNPVRTATQAVGWNIETLYPFSNKLFIGSSTGMFIYDISNPAYPSAQGQFTHVRACDPVIADGDYAYVTLRNGNACSGTSNQLDVINISNVFSPSLARTYPMTNPYGLAKDNNLLFICDGKAGLKIFDVSNPLAISLKKQISDIETYDAIASNGNLLVVAKDGLYQYDYSVPGSLSLESKIPVNH